MPPIMMSRKRLILIREVKRSLRNLAHMGQRRTPKTPRLALTLLEDGISLYLIRCVTERISTVR